MGKINEKDVATALEEQDALFRKTKRDDTPHFGDSNNGETGVFKQLNIVAANIDLWGYLVEQRSHVPKGHEAKNDGNYLTKAVIKLAKRGHREEVDELVGKMFAQWRRLGELNLRGDFRYQRESEFGQELVEALVVLYYIHLFNDCEKMLDRFPHPEPANQRYNELGESADKYWIIVGITPQMWLAGLGDVPGELGKIVHDRILNDSPSVEKRIELLRSYLGVAEEIYQFLEQGEDLPSSIIDNSYTRFFGATYRGKVGNIGRIILNTKLEILGMENMASVHESHGLTKNYVTKEEV